MFASSAISKLSSLLASDTPTNMIIGLSVASAVIVVLIVGIVLTAVVHRDESHRKHRRGKSAKTSKPETLPVQKSEKIAPREAQSAPQSAPQTASQNIQSAPVNVEPLNAAQSGEKTVAQATIVTEIAQKSQPKAANMQQDGEIIPAGARLRTLGLVAIRYDKSYYARLCQADAETKKYYEELKAEMLSYGAKSRISWKHETFKFGRKLLMKMKMRGKTLCLYFALSAADYADTKYKVEDATLLGYDDTPCLYRIFNARRCKFAKELIAQVAIDSGLSKGDIPKCSAPAYESTPALLKKDLVREIRYKKNGEEDEVAAADAEKVVAVASEVDDIMEDEEAKALIESSGRRADKTRTAIINVDTIGKLFKDGEVVTLQEIAKRTKGYDRATYLKVLARGTLDKSLTVEADDFSIEAVKMILLTGGKVLKTVK